MAKKRLNKKVALIGSVVFVFLMLAAIVLILYLNRNPEKFVKDGDAAVLAKDYEEAERNYHKARSLAKTDSLRITVLFKLVDMYIENDQWPEVLGCWQTIIRIDPKNLKARFGRLKYVYLMADSGARQWWQEVASQASEFIEVAEEAEVLMEDTAQWDPFVGEEGAGRERLGPYLYLLRGRAVHETTRMGAFTDPNESLARAIDDLKKVQELEPDNIGACWHLAQALITKGQILASRGELEERDKAEDSTLELLEQAVKVAAAEPRAHVNLLSVKLMLARRRGAEQAEERILSLEPEYLSLVEKFPSSAEAFSALAGYYRMRLKNLDRAIEAAEKAVELDKENVGYVISAAYLHYRKFSIYGQKSELYKATETAKNALTLPDAQDKPGPRQWANRMNRISLYVFLAECYITQIIEPREVITEAQKQEWLTKAEQAVREIEQLFGIGEAPQVIKWRGMLELAKGNRNGAIGKLYTAYQQTKATKPPEPPWPRDPQYARLAYTLAEIFKNTSEVGAVAEFVVNALYSGIVETKPEALLDYAEVLLKLNLWQGAISNINTFEENFWVNERSRTLRVAVLVGANQFDEAEKELAKRQPDDPNTIKLNLAVLRARIRQVQRAIAQKQMEESSPIILQDLESPEKEAVGSQESVRLMKAELESCQAEQAQLVERLLVIEPNSVGEASIVAVYNNYIAEGKRSEAEALVNRFLEYFPDNVVVLFYRQLLLEPEPGKTSEQRHKEIEEQVLLNIADPIRRAVNLGTFYHRNGELEKAAVEFRKVFKIEALQEGVVEEPAVEQKKEVADSRRVAAGYLFDVALAAKDWELSERIAEAAGRENLDGCEGRFFAARLDVARKQYQDAKAKLEECLKQRPVFSLAFLLRSSVNTALGNEHSSLEDARKAASLNPLDGTIAKALAFVLYQRNRKLGNNVSSEQMIETKRALEKAIALNTGDVRLQLLSLYAGYISPTEPSKALAIRQRLQKVAPSVENALLLGKMATNMAFDEANTERKDALFDIADSSFEQARTLAPQNKAVLEAQVEYYRLTGQVEKAERLALKSQDQRLLWVHYLRSGRFEDAKRVLEQLYKSEAKDTGVVKGLLLVAEKTADKEAVKKYSEELLSLEDSADNRLVQIQTFLRTGLVKEAEYKLQSFGEKFPDESRALLLEAWLAMKQGQLKRALVLINRTLQTDQDSALPWRLRGQVNFLMANYDQAIDDLKTSKSLLPEAVTRVTLAKAYLQVGRVEDAITELKNTIDHSQTLAGGGDAGQSARELLERIYLRRRKGALKRFYDETLAELPDSVLWHNRAGAFAMAEGEFERAEQLYWRAMQITDSKTKSAAESSKEDQLSMSLDGYLRALVLGAGTPNATGWNPAKLGKVFEEGRKYIDSDFAPIAYLRMAEAKIKLGDKAAATEYCQQALAKSFSGTGEIFASEILRRMYSLLGAEEVLKYCKQRLETDPESLAANLALFNLMTIDGQYNKAIGYIDKCIKIVGPDSPRRLRYIIRKVTVLEQAYSKTSDNNYLKRGIAEYESLLAKMPNNTIVLNNLAYMLARDNENLAEALKYAKRAHEARPNNPGLLDTYAYVLYKNGQNSRADEFMQAALQQYEQDGISVPADVYEHLGMIKEELGAKVEAVAAYKQALEVGADELSQPAIERIESAIEGLSQ